MGWLEFMKKSKGGSEEKVCCPKCNKLMIKKTRQGVTIDKCISCGGIWLDKGEIFKIIKHLRKDK